MPNFVVKQDGTNSILVLNGGCIMNKPTLMGQLFFCNKGKNIFVFQERSGKATETKVVAGIIDNPVNHWLKGNVTYEMIESLLELNSTVSFETFSVLLRVLNAPAEDQPAKFLLGLREKGITEEDIISASGELAKKFV